MRKIRLIIIPTTEAMPPEDVLVLIEGGVGRWRAGRWITETGSCAGRVIEWDVDWWAHLPVRPV